MSIRDERERCEAEREAEFRSAYEIIGFFVALAIASLIFLLFF